MGERLRDTRLYPLWAALIGALILLPGLGSYGLWEPHEIKVATRANEIANHERADADAAINNLPPTAAARAKHRQSAPELTEDLVAFGLQHFGGGEGGGRLPLALLALVAILAAYFLGLRLANPRAGLIAALMCASFPLIILNGRHLTSDIGAITGSAVLTLGLVGLLTRRSFGFVARHHPVHYAVDAALVGAGVWLAYASAGVFLGLLPPFAGVGVAAGAVALGDRRRRRLERLDRLHLYVGGGLALAAAFAAFFVFFTETFDVKDADEKDTGLAAEITGKSFEPASEYTDALGGVWRERADLRVGFSTVFERVAYGTFPWIAIIPIAIAAALVRRREEEEEEEEEDGEETGRGKPARANTTGTLAVVMWTFAAYAVASVFIRKVGGATFPAVVGLAAVGGVWLERVMPRAGEAGDRRGPLPLVALFAVACAVVVGRDLIAFGDRLTSLNLPRTTLPFPDGVSAHIPWIGVGWAAALAVAVALLYRGADDPDRAGKWYHWLPGAAAHRAQRGGVIAGVVLGVLSAFCLTQLVTPALSARLSTKNILATYHELGREGDALGIMGTAAGAAYYAGKDHETLRGRNQLVDFIRRDNQRVFALVPKSELCPFNKIAREKKFAYYVLDASSAQYRLLSNRLLEGEHDQNPLAGIFASEPPADIGKRVTFNLDNQLELIGYTMPASAKRGSTFTMRLYFKVLKRVSRNWKKVLVHLDRNVKINADHEPAGGHCGTAYWVPGDIVVDEFEVTAGSRAHPSGDYKVYTGLFVGTAGNWTNMKVISGGTTDDRIPLGTIKLQ